MRKTHEYNDIVNAAEIAKRLGVGVPAVSNWGKRYKKFPKPLPIPGVTISLYSWKAVSAWYLDRKKLTPADLAKRAQKLRDEYEAIQQLMDQ